METGVGANSFSLSRWLFLAVGMALLPLSLYPFLDFPVVGLWLLMAGAGYLLLLFFFPFCWLLILPMMTVSIDLATYTGRFLFNEYDLFFLITISFALISGRFDVGITHRKWAFSLVVAYFAVVMSTFDAWSVFLFPPESVGSNPYYLPEYSYKLVRGLLWAFLLTPLWLHLYKRDQRRTVNWFICGQCAAALLLGLIILWERGSLGVVLSGAAWYHIVNSVLDLTSSYRTTGIFSDMHTGGEVVDGVLLLLLPASIFGVLYADNLRLKVFALLAFCALAYCATVGFTRATYVSFFLACSAFALLHMVSRWLNGTHRDDIPYLLILATLLVGLVASFSSYSRGGSYALFACNALVVVALVAVKAVSWHRLAAMAGGLFIALLLVVFAVKAHLDSRWVEHSINSAIVIALLQTFFFGLATRLFLGFRSQSNFNNLLLGVLLIMLPSIFAIALGGYKINERMETVVDDLETRLSHWRDVETSSGRSLKTALLGNGNGTFPANYAYHFPEVVKKVGSFVVEQEGGGSYLRMGAGEDLAFGQRVPVLPERQYKAELLVRAGERTKLAVFICERNLIFASNFQSNCSAKSVRLEDTGGEFKPVVLTVDSGRVGARHIWSRWPTTVYIKNMSREAVIDIDNISFRLDDENLLDNGSFSAGLDGWFFYNDYQHLPWHVKNIYVQSWYDNGLIGLMLFLVMGVAVALLPVFHPQVPSLYTVFAVGVIGMGAFGLFGSPLDSARVSWIFYFYLFVALLRPADDVLCDEVPEE